MTRIVVNKKRPFFYEEEKAKEVKDLTYNNELLRRKDECGEPIMDQYKTSKCLEEKKEKERNLPNAGENNTTVHIAYQNVYLAEFYKTDRHREAFYDLGLVSMQFNTGFTRDICCPLTFIQFKDLYEAGNEAVILMVDNGVATNAESLARAASTLINEGNLFCGKVELFRAEFKSFVDLLTEEQAQALRNHSHIKQAQERSNKLLERLENLMGM